MRDMCAHYYSIFMLFATKQEKNEPILNFICSPQITHCNGDSFFTWQFGFFIAIIIVVVVYEFLSVHFASRVQESAVSCAHEMKKENRFYGSSLFAFLVIK